MPDYHDRASCRYLTHKHASFYGCTIEEMGIILGIYALIEIPILSGISLLVGQYLGGFFGAFLLLFLIFSMFTFFVLLKNTARYIGRLRNGRQAGYLKLRFRQRLHEMMGASMPYVDRNGQWVTRRHG